MNGENQQLVTDEPVAFEKSPITDRGNLQTLEMFTD
jgi:hypothetical protein